METTPPSGSWFPCWAPREVSWKICNNHVVLLYTILWTVPFVTLCLICNFTWRLLYFKRLLQSFWLMLLLTKSFCKINFTIESTCNFVISTVPADGLTPNGARPSTSTVMSKCRYHIFRGPVHEKLPCYWQTHSSHSAAYAIASEALFPYSLENWLNRNRSLKKNNDLSLLPLHLHSWLNTWFQWIGQKQLQDEN